MTSPEKRKNRASRFFLSVGDKIKKWLPRLEVELKQADMSLDAREFCADIFKKTIISFAVSIVCITIVIFLIELQQFLLPVLFGIMLIHIFMFYSRIKLVRYMAIKRLKSIDSHLLATLERIQIGLNAGISLFDLFVFISKSNYGEVSREFEKTVERITAGEDQVSVLEDICQNNPSIIFKKDMGLLINGIKSGGDLRGTLKEIISDLSKKEVNDIRGYGQRLHLLSFLYMIVVVVLPTLGVIFLSILFSFISIGKTYSMVIFIALLGTIFFFQIFFMGLIEVNKPGRLMSD